LFVGGQGLAEAFVELEHGLDEFDDALVELDFGGIAEVDGADGDSRYILWVHFWKHVFSKIG